MEIQSQIRHGHARSNRSTGPCERPYCLLRGYLVCHLLKIIDAETGLYLVGAAASPTASTTATTPPTAAATITISPVTATALWLVLLLLLHNLDNLFGDS